MAFFVIFNIEDNMKIEIIKLTENPLQHIGKVAGTCWNAPIDNSEQNIKRAKNCIKSRSWPSNGIC